MNVARFSASLMWGAFIFTAVSQTMNMVWMLAFESAAVTKAWFMGWQGIVVPLDLAVMCGVAVNLTIRALGVTHPDQGGEK